MSRTSIARLVAIHAVLLAITGVVLLFAPAAVFPGAAAAGLEPLPQLVAAALLGFAAANWTARASILGAIYGRAVVVGNQMFSFVATLVLLQELRHGPAPAVWALLGVLGAGAVLYSVLLYRPPRAD